MTIIISLLLLVSLLPNPTFTADVGIVNGREAEPHSRPYMVSLQKNGYHICGGSLISDQFVLTAAHCWCQGQVLTVVVGAHDLRDNNLRHIEVESYIPHPNYTPYYLWNDIMLLKLKTKVQRIANTGVISLPKYGEDVKAGALCSVAGWGDLKTNGSGSNRLMEANMATRSDPECERKWGENYRASMMICAHGSGGSCQGDSGGPLVCGKKPTAFGITSFTSETCNSFEHPNGYTRISTFLSWIHKEIQK